MRGDAVRGQGGFTLPEMMVTITMMVVVLFALLSIFDASIRVFSLGNDKVEAIENARLGSTAPATGRGDHSPPRAGKRGIHRHRRQQLHGIVRQCQRRHQDRRERQAGHPGEGQPARILRDEALELARMLQRDL